MYTKILVGIDYSEPSLSALRWTADRFSDAELVDLRRDLEVQTIILTGRPITAWILSTAETEAADLIAAGRSHAPGITGRAPLGGITARLMRDAASSVLVVPV